MQNLEVCNKYYDKTNRPFSFLSRNKNKKSGWFTKCQLLSMCSCFQTLMRSHGTSKQKSVRYGHVSTGSTTDAMEPMGLTLISNLWTIVFWVCLARRWSLVMSLKGITSIGLIKKSSPIRWTGTKSFDSDSQTLTIYGHFAFHYCKWKRNEKLNVMKNKRENMKKSNSVKSKKKKKKDLGKCQF